MSAHSCEAWSEVIVARLVVHVGPPKTASTYFQQALFANADVLAANGVYLPVTGRSEFSPNSVCHHHLAWELVSGPRFRPAIGGWDGLRAELATVDAQTVLISSEVLSWVILNEGKGELLNQKLLSLGREVTVVYVVRDQLSLLSSQYAQRVKLLQGVAAFGPHIAGVLRRGDADLEVQTARWYDSPDFAFVAVPLPHLSEPNPLVALLGAARIDVPPDQLVVGSEVVNISLGPVAVEAFKLLRAYLHGLHPAISDDDMAVRRLHRIAARRARELGWCEDAFWGWPPTLAARAAEQLAPSNERFAQAVWGTSWPLPLPVDRPQARAQLIKLPSAELDRVHDFVITMARRYATLRSGPARD